LLVGVDMSGKMIDYARARAIEAGVDNRVEFHVMDALRMLEFPTKFFDLVNQRFSQSYLRTWDWPKLLQEYQRVIRPDGVIRVTEGNSAIESNSLALTRIWELSVQALHQGGYFFAPKGDSIINELPILLKHRNFQDVQTCAVTLEYRAGTSQGQLFAQDMEHLFRTGEPFLRKWLKIPDDYRTLCQQASNEMQQPDFLAKWHLLTAWCVRSSLASLAEQSQQ
jgi:ubiquinone/menaquinone biosynthesis C-methylase UbiE